MVWTLVPVLLAGAASCARYVPSLRLQNSSAPRALKLAHKINIDWEKATTSQCSSNFLTHSSLLRTFGFSVTTTYNSYLPLIFGKFPMIWGHFKNICECHFWGHWGRWGQTTSKSKTMKILNENLLKLDEIQNLASATSKMTSWPQWPRKRLSGFFQKIHF